MDTSSSSFVPFVELDGVVEAFPKGVRLPVNRTIVVVAETGGTLHYYEMGYVDGGNTGSVDLVEEREGPIAGLAFGFVFVIGGE